MFRTFEMFLLISLLAATALGSYSCETCFTNSRTILLNEGFVRTYSNQEKALFRIEWKQGAIDTIEMFVTDRELIFTDRGGADDCPRYTEAYLTMLETEDEQYRLKNYLMADDSLIFPRQIAIDFRYKDTVLFMLRPADYPFDLVDSTLRLDNFFDSLQVHYKADSGMLKASSEQMILRRIE